MSSPAAGPPAARLPRGSPKIRSKTVCLIEAGGEGRNLLIRAPAGIIALLPGRPKINNWAFETVPQQGLGGRKGYQPRGKALGGSSAINAMLYTRGHRGDYDEWADLGCDGWSWDEVLPYFRRAEGNQRGADALHGGDGPLRVAEQQEPRAARQGLCRGLRRKPDPAQRRFQRARAGRGRLYQVTQFWGERRNGERCSAAAAYLHPAMSRPNLTVITGAHATGIVLDGKRATGVRYRAGKGEAVAKASARGHRLRRCLRLAAALLLSGIGPAVELAVHGIPVVHELPGVGKNLQDHLDFIMAWTSKDADMMGIGLRGLPGLLRHLLRWRRDGSGMIATPYAEGGAFLKSDPAIDRPDLQLHFCIAHRRRSWPQAAYGLSAFPAMSACCGRIRAARSGCRAPNPLAPPRIDPRFLSDERDAELLLKGVRMMRGILEAPALAKYRDKEIYTAGVSERRRADGPYPRSRRHDLSPGRHLQDGRRRAWRWSIRNCGCTGCRACGSSTPR